MKIKTFKKGGIHPPENKLTATMPICSLPVAPELCLYLSQCIGAPSKAVVKTGDKVSAGQLIAEAGGFVGAPIHSPVNGTVGKIELKRSAQGFWQEAISIVPDAEAPLENNFISRTEEEIKNLTPEDIRNIVGNSGIVGLGGATFPTKVKLTVPQGKKAEYILINGAECEPYLTCDDRLMQESPDEIVKGGVLLLRAAEAAKIIIGIEDNKPQAIRDIQEAVTKNGLNDQISTVPLKKKYPQGSEKQLIKALTGKTVPAGGLPIDTGCIVDNVATAFAVYEAVYLNKPLFERILTVSGKGFEKPGNYRVINGTPVEFILQQCGGLPQSYEEGKLIAGGPMMGRAVSDLSSYATKGLSGLVFLQATETLRRDVLPCIRCSKCITVCPMGLEPYLFMMLAGAKDWDTMNRHGVMNCLECGCCSYACPASRPLLDMIKLGKQELRKRK